MDCQIVKHFRGSFPWRRGLTAALLIVLSAGLLACHRKTPDEMFKEAYDLLQQRDVIGAEMKFEKILQSNPTGPVAVQAHYQLAICYLRENEYDRGREELDKVLKAIGYTNPDDSYRVIADKINSYVMEKKPEQAITATLATSNTLHGAPEELRQNVQLLLAGVYLNAGKEDKANEICNQIIKQWPNVPDLHKAALALLVRTPQAKKDYAKALGLLQHYLADHTSTTLRADLLSDMGYYLKNMNKPEESKKIFDESEGEYHKQIAAAVGAKDKTALLFKLALTQQGRGDMGASRQTLRQVIKEFPNTDFEAVAKFKLSELDLAENKYPEAISTLQEIIKTNPGSQAAATAGKWIESIHNQMLRQTSGTLARTTGTLARTTGTLGRMSGKQAATSATLPTATPASAARKAAPTSATQGGKAHS